jgi:hypothetical protein
MQEAKMPARRDRIARCRYLVVAIEGADHFLDRRFGNDVLVLDLASELPPQRLDIDGHASSSRRCGSVLNPPP